MPGKKGKQPSGPTRAEKRKAREHGGRHVGGPGKPDYSRGGTKGEVKTRKTPVTGPELQELADRGISEIDSKAGFTGPAIELARRLGIRLVSKGKDQ